jgi:hypothetical protein
MARKLPKWMRDRNIEPVKYPQSGTHNPLGDGPGTVLLEMNKRDYGVPACSDCNATARKMNEGGPTWCCEHIEELLDEIQPRVQDWLAKGEVGGEKVTEPTWQMRMAAKSPDAAKRWKIRSRILTACDTYEQQRRDALPTDVAELWSDPTEEEWPALQQFAEAWEK